MGIKVKAKTLGIYNGRRIRPGDIFEIQPGDPRGAWMIEVDAEMPGDKNRPPFTSVIPGVTKGAGNVAKAENKILWQDPIGEGAQSPPVVTSDKEEPEPVPEPEQPAIVKRKTRKR